MKKGFWVNSKFLLNIVGESGICGILNCESGVYFRTVLPEVRRSSWIDFDLADLSDLGSFFAKGAAAICLTKIKNIINNIITKNRKDISHTDQSYTYNIQN